MALKEYGIAENKKLKAYGYKQGNSQYGHWQFFTFIEKVKDQTNQYIPVQKYQIWITNQEALNLADGTDVEIGKISKVSFHWHEYNGRKDRICDVSCEVRVASVQHQNNKGVAGNNYIPNQQQQSQTPVFNGGSPFDSVADDEDLPF